MSPARSPRKAGDCFGARLRRLSWRGLHRSGAGRLTGSTANPSRLSDGTIEVADERFIRDSILKPRAKITAGYQPLMPSYEGKIYEDELVQITAYIKSLAARGRLRHDDGRNYLTEDNSLRSWFFTTDHKRVAVLYFAGITLFFFIGGAAATVIRLELVTPQGDLVTADVYNRLFTIHGVVMVWFFLIPSIPNTLGNFIVPLMIGARDLAFPRLNLASWYHLHAGRLRHALRRVRRRHRHWLDVLHAVLDDVFQQPCGAGRHRRLHRRILVDPHRPELHRHNPPAARAGSDLVPAAAVPVVALCHLRHPRAGDAGTGDDAASHRARPLCRHRHLRSGATAATRSCSSICSGSTRIRRSTS